MIIQIWLKYLEKLICQLKQSLDSQLTADCLKILTSMIMPIQTRNNKIDIFDRPSNEALGSYLLKITMKGLDDSVSTQREEEKRVEIQNKLGNLGALQESIDLLQLGEDAIIVQALTLCCPSTKLSNSSIMLSLSLIISPLSHVGIRLRILLIGTEILASNIEIWFPGHPLANSLRVWKS